MDNEAQKPPVVVIAGPTASGKTSLSIRLAERFDGEIISADAMAVYRRMDVGTAKPTAGEQARVPHHLVDVVEPDEPFDAARFSRLAREAAAKIHARGKKVFVAGGTGLYIRAFLYGLFAPGKSDPTLRNRLRAEAEALGAPALHARLARVDPAAAGRIHQNDAVRIVRALEVATLAEAPISRLQEEHGFSQSPYRHLSLCLAPEREDLYARINRRTDLMLEQGLVEEVETLLQQGYDPTSKPFQSIGYKEVVRYLAGGLGFEEMRKEIAKQTRRFAKRQLTWFKKEPGMQWVRPDQEGEIFRLVEDFLGAGAAPAGE
ncbi:MAG: tRNA (adenosine(37)-N6)-dimethylallyltransferase MiaA [Deltaproteobacteria bacterium]|nr:tRNA (adenosine(37)-N6)-dimethylallyltransferase MiaA [Deltaproteobacteria bacterium]